MFFASLAVADFEMMTPAPRDQTFEIQTETKTKFSGPRSSPRPTFETNTENDTKILFSRPGLETNISRTVWDEAYERRSSKDWYFGEVIAARRKEGKLTSRGLTTAN